MPHNALIIIMHTENGTTSPCQAVTARCSHYLNPVQHSWTCWTQGFSPSCHWVEACDFRNKFWEINPEFRKIGGKAPHIKSKRMVQKHSFSFLKTTYCMCMYFEELFLWGNSKMLQHFLTWVHIRGHKFCLWLYWGGHCQCSKAKSCIWFYIAHQGY